MEHDAATSTNNSSSTYVSSKLTFESLGEGSQTMIALNNILQSFDIAHLKFHSVSVPTKTVTVEHNPFFLSAATILQSLSEEAGLRGEVALDGAENMSWDPPKAPKEEAQEESESTLRPTVIVSGLFWIISMLSFIGENWYVSEKNQWVRIV